MTRPARSLFPNDFTRQECRDAVEGPRREKMLAARRDRHGTMLAVCLIALAMSFSLSIRDNHVSWANAELPILCGSRFLFGLDCPGCGLTRSFVALADGDWEASYTYHRVGWLLFLAVLLQIPYRTYRLWRLRTEVAEPKWPRYFGYLLIVSLIGNWLWNIWP